MNLQKLSILDTLFRDGTQSSMWTTTGLKDAIAVIKILNSLGFEYLELGFASSNGADSNRIKEALKLGLRAKIAAFGRTVMQDAETILNLKVPVGVLVGKARANDVQNTLRKKTEDYLKEVDASIRLLTQNGVEVLFDAEHYFQAVREDNISFVREIVQTASKAGAGKIVFCDTNGAMTPEQVRTVLELSVQWIPWARMGVHFHNDRGRALANAETAYGCGVPHIQGVFGGFGERVGNTDLSVLIPNLFFDLGCQEIDPEKLCLFHSAYNSICEHLGIRPDNHHPWVGKDSFYTAAGMHSQGLEKDPGSYLHADPELVGNSAKFGVTELSGKTTIAIKARELGVVIPEGKLSHLAKQYKILADRGVSFSEAEASFHLWLLRSLGTFTEPLKFDEWRIIDERFKGAKANSEAVLGVTFNNEKEKELFVSRGDGPVNALEKVLRRALEGRFPIIANVRMTDFSLRTVDMQKGSAALVRIYCEFSDGVKSWKTVGVNADSFDAAWEALFEGYFYIIALAQTN
jgi:2-isopropylmalate synthase